VAGGGGAVAEPSIIVATPALDSARLEYRTRVISSRRELGDPCETAHSHWSVAVDGGAGHFFGPTRRKNRVASNVERLGAGLHDATHDDVVDYAWIDAGAIDQGLEGFGCKVHGMPSRETTTAAATGGTNNVDDYCFMHEELQGEGIKSKNRTNK
jgi:hypothetical protein